MVNFSIKPGASPRFEGEFEIVPENNHVATTVEQTYLDTLRRVNDALADDEAQDSAVKPATALIIAKKQRRKKAAQELLEEAESFAKNDLDAGLAADNALVIKGKYVADRDRYSASPFVVRELIDPQTTLASNLLISVAPILPEPNDAVTSAKQALYVSIDNALTVIKTVAARTHGKKRPISYQLHTTSRGDRMLDQYVRKLGGIGRLGLEGSHVQLAVLALDGLKAEFVMQEAGRIKNSYIRHLGQVAGLAAVLLFGLYALIESKWIGGQFWSVRKAFFVAAAGAAIGSWLSFSIRRVALSFNDLAVLEEDLLEPSVRVVFVIGLTMIACLLFWTGVMNIEIGRLKTTTLTGSTALLVGLFCGIAERALATAISGRAATFVRGLAG